MQLVAGAVMVQAFDTSLTAVTVYVFGVRSIVGAVTAIVADASPATAVTVAGGSRRYACVRPWYLEPKAGQPVAEAKRYTIALVEPDKMPEHGLPKSVHVG